MKMQIVFIAFLAVLGLLFLLVFGVAELQTANAQSHPVIKPSEIIEALRKQKSRNPKISAKELADFGNKRLLAEGLNFGFNTCEIAEANNITEEFSENFRPFKYKLKDLSGREIVFQIMIKDFGYPCGCSIGIPVFQITENEMTVRADNKQARLQRPKEFVLDEVELVDESLKKTIRKWQMPGDNVPFGISKDGTKEYVDTGYDHELINEVVLEICDRGNIRFVPRNDVQIITNGTELEDFPKDPNNAYLGFKKFKAGKTNYILKFSYPCT